MSAVQGDAEVALMLFDKVVAAEGKVLTKSPGIVATDRAWILNAYVDCILAVRDGTRPDKK
jgi:hypothetical protein